jgi:hypothetical protein
MNGIQSAAASCRYFSYTAEPAPADDPNAQTALPVLLFHRVRALPRRQKPMLKGTGKESTFCHVPAVISSGISERTYLRHRARGKKFAAWISTTRVQNATYNPRMPIVALPTDQSPRRRWRCFAT